ncbi:putative secreted protein (plasmid) [Burkholderia sp. YI23]|nr:putative secreted protein [Burkholderia sp. YI23]
MKARITLSLGTLLLISSSIACQAQQTQPAPQQPPSAAARSLTKEQQAALDKQDQDIAQAASAIVGLIDQNKAGEVWDDASPIAKQIISRDDFIRKVVHDRAPLGTPGLRMPMGVKHYRYDGTGNMPAGAYINVLFDTQYSQARQSSREMVTFILDADNVWRFVGYSLR